MLTNGYGLLIFILLNVMTRSELITQKDQKHTTDNSQTQPQLPSFDDPPPCSDGLPFCENIESYPYDHIKYVLDKNPIYKRLFANAGQKDEAANRSEEENYLCKSMPKIVYPKIGKNKDGEWKYIVNQDQFTQIMRVNICKRLGGHCDIIGDIPEDAETACTQKYVHSTMLSLSDEGSPAIDLFQVPSACCCSFTRNLDFAPDDV